MMQARKPLWSPTKLQTPFPSLHWTLPRSTGARWIQVGQLRGQLRGIEPPGVVGRSEIVTSVIHQKMDFGPWGWKIACSLLSVIKHGWEVFFVCSNMKVIQSRIIPPESSGITMDNPFINGIIHKPGLNTYWGFLKWGYPPVIILFWMGVSILNHPAIGVPPF